MSRIWLEAEAFDEPGGWVIDQQSMEQMGSAYLMAHGMGVPVADAQTVCEVPEAGRWTVWVRTRDWTAPWKRGTPGGTFQVLVNGAALPETLGTNGPDWAWQKAGDLPLPRGPVTIALHDLTGFNGRCDALYLATDPADVPPDEPTALAAFRRAAAGLVCTDDAELYDLAVAGGGLAGVCAAVAAARSGATVVIIQDRAVMGGCNSSEIRVPLGGHTHVPPYPALGNVVREIAPIAGRPGVLPAEYYEDTRKANVFATLPPGRCRVLLNTRVVALEKDAGDRQRIAALVARDVRTGAETRLRAKLFADCTGDAQLARMMGAQTMYGREPREQFSESLAPLQGDAEVMGMSVIWCSEQAAGPTTFPEIDWGLEITEDNAYYVRSGDWEWETGQYRDQADDTEAIRDYGLMAIFANWSYLKNRSPRRAEFACDRLRWITHLGGKRESYRVVGDYVLTQQDVEREVVQPDATASVTWSIDLHFPDPAHLARFAEPFRSCAYHRNLEQPAPVPYRCLYARDARNLFLGGRTLSASHVAFGAVRVMRTLGLLGEVIGLAAALCAREGLDPRDLYPARFGELQALMEQGVPAPETYHNGGMGHRYEGYHFADTGHLGVYPERSPKLDEPEVKARVEALGLQHLEE